MPQHTRCRRIGARLSVVGFVAGAAMPLHAQSLPSASGTDLTLPPDMRPGAQMQPSALPIKEKRKPYHADRRHAAASADPAAPPSSSHAARPDEHPVDLGVTMRGGSGTARAYAPTGDSPVLQESGSAFGAGMKFGF